MFVRKEGDMAIPTGLYRGKLHIEEYVENWNVFVDNEFVIYVCSHLISYSARIAQISNNS